MSCLSRPSEAEMLGVPDLDAETQHALFPNFPAADHNSRWKWSDIGAAPALGHFVHRTQHTTADKAIACNGHEQEAHEKGVLNALPNTAPETAKQQTSAEPHKTGDRTALNQGRSAPMNQRLSPTVHTRGPSCSPDPAHYLVSLRWGALSTPPLHPQPSIPQHNSACLSGSRSQSPSPPRFSTSPSHYHVSPVSTYEASNPNRGVSPEQRSSIAAHCSSPSEGLFAASPMGNEGRYRSASPSVARACVTLPGFCTPAKARRLAEGTSTEEQHEPAATPFAGKHFRQSMHKFFATPLFCCFAALLLSSVCL